MKKYTKFKEINLFQRKLYSDEEKSYLNSKKKLEI